MVQQIHNQTKVQTHSLTNKDNSAQKSHINSSKSGNLNNKMDTVTLTKSSENQNVYSSALTPGETADKSYDMLRRLVTSMLKEQGIDFQVAVSDSSTIDISELTPEEAQALVADDGYFGVEKTSDRIVNFAISLAGGDVSKLDKIKEGVENGFNEALDAFGGTLPDISYDTFDAVMQKLDAWAAEAQSDEA